MVDGVQNAIEIELTTAFYEAKKPDVLTTEK